MSSGSTVWTVLAIAGLLNIALAASGQDSPDKSPDVRQDWLVQQQAEFAAYEFSLEAAEPRMSARIRSPSATVSAGTRNRPAAR